VIAAWLRATFKGEVCGCPTGTVCISEIGGVAGGGGSFCSPVPEPCHGHPNIAGAKPGGVSSYLTGKIDELRAYTRVLSAGEVALLYNPLQTCVASSCGGCPPGTTSCSGVCTNTAADKNNCNVCGNVCPGAQQCIGSTCM
jgi:hypothetical protein